MILQLAHYQTSAGNESAREWLRSLTKGGKFKQLHLSPIPCTHPEIRAIVECRQAYDDRWIPFKTCEENQLLFLKNLAEEFFTPFEAEGNHPGRLPF